MTTLPQFTLFYLLSFRGSCFRIMCRGVLSFAWLFHIRGADPDPAWPGGIQIFLGVRSRSPTICLNTFCINKIRCPSRINFFPRRTDRSGQFHPGSASVLSEEFYFNLVVSGGGGEGMAMALTKEVRKEGKRDSYLNISDYQYIDIHLGRAHVVQEQEDKPVYPFKF